MYIYKGYSLRSKPALARLRKWPHNDPEPDVPKDVTPMAQCAFESLVFNVSAVYTN